MLGNIFLTADTITAGGVEQKASYVMYKNLIGDCTVTAGGDVGRLYDGMTNIYYSASAGTTTIDLTLPSMDSVNCFAIAGLNWISGDVTARLYTWNGSSYVLKIEATGESDTMPLMRVFDTVYTDKVRIQFVSTAALYVGECAFGLALQMPSLPSVGLQPAEWSDEDEVSYSQTQSLNFGPSTIQRRGSQQVMQFNYVTTDFMDNQWRNFRAVAKGYPVWVGWNQTDRLGAVIYGHWEANKPKFDTSFFTSIQLTIKGVAA